MTVEYVVELPGATAGVVVCVGSLTASGLTVNVAVALAVATAPEQPVGGYSVAVIVKVPPAAPAFTDASLKLAVLPETTTQLLVGAVKVAPVGGLGAESATWSPLIPPEIVIGVYVVELPAATGFVVWVGTETASVATFNVAVADADPTWSDPELLSQSLWAKE